MKRKKLVCKSVALGLAVATAATTMSVPGGMLNPTAVYAENVDIKDLPESENPLLYNGSETPKEKYNADLEISVKDGWQISEDGSKFENSITFTKPEYETDYDGGLKTIYLQNNGEIYKKNISVVFDTQKPILTITKEEEVETSEANISLKFSINEEYTTTYYVCSKESKADITVDEIKNSGKKIESSMVFFFENLMLEDNTRYHLYAVSEDNAGNIGDIVSYDFTTVQHNDITGKTLLTSQNFSNYFDYTSYQIVSEEELEKGIIPNFHAKDGSCDSTNGFNIKYMDMGDGNKKFYHDTVKKTGFYGVRIKPTDDNKKFYSNYSEIQAYYWNVYLPMPKNLIKIVYYDANGNVVNCMKNGGKAVISADGYKANKGAVGYEYEENAVIDDPTAEGEGTLREPIAFQKDGIDYVALVTLSYVAPQKPASIVATPELGALNEKTHTLEFTGGAGAAYEYSLDGGKKWMDIVLDGTKGSISLGNKSYAANAIQIRAKETETNAAGTAVAYDKAIVAVLEGNVVILNIDDVKKYGQTITAKVTGTQEGAALKYTFIRVKDGTETVAQETSDKAEYTIGKEDIGCTLKVKVTADGYDEGKPLESTKTQIVKKADGRNVESVAGYMQQEGESYKYTVTPVPDAEYRMNDGNWQESNVFTGIKPGTQNVTFSARIREDDCYEAGEVKTSDPVSFAKLNREMPKLSYTVKDGENGSKIVTIDPVEGAVYYNNDGKTDSNVFTVPADKLENVTIGIQLPETDIYLASKENKRTVNLSLETQTAPEAAVLTAKVNTAGTGYDIIVTEPKAEEGVTYEYSNDPLDNFGTLEQLTGLTNVAPGDEVVIYVRKAAVKGKKNASPATACSIKTDLIKAPVITGPATFSSTATVTMTAAGKIYYTTDGSTPTVNSNLYTDAITIDKTTTIKAIVIENGKPVSDVASLTLTKASSGSGSSSSGSGSSGSGSSGSGATTGTTTPAVKPDSKPETTTETKTDGTVVTTTTTTAEDGTKNVVVELKNEGKSSIATATISKDATGKTVKAEAVVTQIANKKVMSVSGALVAQITEAAGTKNVNVVTSVKDGKGAEIGTVIVNAEKLVAGKKLAIVKVNAKTGEKILVNAKNYKVAKDGSISVSGLKNGKYELVTTKEKTALSKKILKTVTAKKAKKTVKDGAKTTFAFGKDLNKENVKSIKYVSSKKSVAAIDKNGKIKAKKAGQTVVKAVVTLKDGTKKTVKTVITVKAK